MGDEPPRRPSRDHSRDRYRHRRHSDRSNSRERRRFTKDHSRDHSRDRYRHRRHSDRSNSRERRGRDHYRDHSRDRHRYRRYSDRSNSRERRRNYEEDRDRKASYGSKGRIGFWPHPEKENFHKRQAPWKVPKKRKSKGKYYHYYDHSKESVQFTVGDEVTTTNRFLALTEEDSSVNQILLPEEVSPPEEKLLIS